MRVLLLGDSTSFTGGFYPKTYPIILAGQNIWPSGTEIINPSVAGFTAADALIFYKDHIASSPPPDIVIVMLGNCDACKTPKPKGQPGTFGQQIKRFLPNLGTSSRRNLFLPNTFDTGFNASLEQPESIEDFSANIRALVRRVVCDGGLPILVAPIANKEFLAGAGKGNFIFYRTYGLRRDLSEVADRVPSDLWEAIQASRRGDDISAKAIYQKLKSGGGSASDFPEVEEIAANNLAILTAEGGDFRSGRIDLRERLDQSPIRPEIFLFNLARIQRASGNEAQAAQSFIEAFESDATMYRIREPYRDAIKTISREVAEVRFLDLEPYSAPQNMLDHCHPNEDGHKIWADAVSSVISDKVRGDRSALIINCPMNPEYGHGNKAELPEFLFSNNTEDEVLREIHLKRLICAAKAHPLFADGADISLRPPSFQFELGRLPDAYLTRLLAPYLSAIVGGGFAYLKLPHIASLQSRLGMFSRSTQLQMQIEKDENVSATITRLINLKGTIEEHLRRHLMKGPDMDYRFHSTIFWYFRESVRYGSHSCHGMLYDRNSVDCAIEAIYGAAVIAQILGVNERAWLSHMGDIARKTIDMHVDAARCWIENYRLAKPTFDMEYVLAKQNLARQI